MRIAFLYLMRDRRKIMRETKINNKVSDKYESERNYHSIVSGVSADKLNAEEMDLYRFMVGGMQAK